jgi:hypothetical protein
VKLWKRIDDTSIPGEHASATHGKVATTIVMATQPSETPAETSQSSVLLSSLDYTSPFELTSNNHGPLASTVASSNVYVPTELQRPDDFQSTIAKTFGTALYITHKIGALEPSDLWFHTSLILYSAFNWSNNARESTSGEKVECG